MSSDSSIENNDSHSLPPRRRRDNLPQAAREYLLQWVRDHIEHPYPTEDQKAVFVQVLKLSPIQVNNWFINARRRDVIKIKIEMGYLLTDTPNNSLKKAIKRPRARDTNMENERRPNSSLQINMHTCGTLPGVSLLKRRNCIQSNSNRSTAGKSSSEMNTNWLEHEYNLKLLSLAALIHNSHC